MALRSPATLSFQAATRQRRSLRSLDSTSSVSDTAIVDLVKDALRIVPSAFNSQTTRATVLLGEEHNKLWKITGDAILKHIGEDRYKAGSKAKMEAFSGARGSILFWDDSAAVEELRKNCPPIYVDKIDEWVHQGNGMCQYHLWVAIEAFGLGVNLQHYNPLINEAVLKEWKLPSAWQLRAQMVFGTPKEGSHPGVRQQKFSIEDSMSVFGGSGASL